MNTLRKWLDSLGYTRDQGWYTTAEAAQHVGVSASTIKRWRNNSTGPGPTKNVWNGGMIVHLYTDEDLLRLIAHKGTLKPGPKA